MQDAPAQPSCFSIFSPFPTARRKWEMRWFAIAVDNAGGRAELVEAARAPAEVPLSGTSNSLLDSAGATTHTPLELLTDARELGFGRLQLAFGGRRQVCVAPSAAPYDCPRVLALFLFLTTQPPPPPPLYESVHAMRSPSFYKR